VPQKLWHDLYLLPLLLASYHSFNPNRLFKLRFRIYFDFFYFIEANLRVASVFLKKKKRVASVDVIFFIIFPSLMGSRVGSMSIGLILVRWVILIVGYSNLMFCIIIKVAGKNISTNFDSIE
jgi:hypothetical protein